MYCLASGSNWSVAIYGTSSEQIIAFDTVSFQIQNCIRDRKLLPSIFPASHGACLRRFGRHCIQNCNSRSCRSTSGQRMTLFSFPQHYCADKGGLRFPNPCLVKMNDVASDMQPTHRRRLSRLRLGCPFPRHASCTAALRQKQKWPFHVHSIA